MLDCTWNDLEAQTALRRMRLEEQKQKLVANKTKRKSPQRESLETRPTLKRAVGAGDYSSSL